MDIMRGWMILEMMMFTDQEKNAVKSSTGNKMDYQSIVRALNWPSRPEKTQEKKEAVVCKATPLR